MGVEYSGLYGVKFEVLGMGRVWVKGIVVGCVCAGYSVSWAWVEGVGKGMGRGCRSRDVLFAVAPFLSCSGTFLSCSGT